MVPVNIHPDKECPECGSLLSWFPYDHPLNAYGGGLSWGRYVCHNYGNCELAPG